ncbi:unnamed protein product [Ambrosiozyma monospora]|uniref:Unnamed protein product n=1 Tax=Ambrosiozyma monospora TaxID=43982 RepID=A0ACB5TA20_AMBMO|nr:unnamed protein product [Ambrosiozyma monospora]
MRHRFSISYDSDGCRRYNNPFPLTNETGLYSFPKLEQGDVIGCGIRTGSRTVFFTRNGKKVSESKIGGHIRLPKGLQMYPTIGATNKCQIHVNLGQLGYVFIEGNVKKWGFGPLEGTEVPPPLYTKFNKDVLLESSDLDPNDLNLRNGDFPPNFWDIIATPAEFTDIDEDADELDEVTMQTLEAQGLRNGDFILPPAEPPLYSSSVEEIMNSNLDNDADAQDTENVVVGTSSDNRVQSKQSENDRN